ncbi:MAG TPA: hypothetical protein VMD07_07115, partial [Candidatus Acidoferrales bacterium]|nr:hypothetical protein [Candidatus Acidoferrales bacterium]
MQTAYAVRFKRWDWDYFLSERKKVLELWPTGKEIASEDALARAVEYHKQQPWYKFAALRNAKAEEENRIQITAQVGHALVDQTIKHIACSEDVKPDRWYVLTDTYSRKNLFEKAQDAVERSKRDGFSYLNGYPPAVHGVAGARAINESTKAAVGTDNNDEDARFNWEILLAGGFTWGTIKHVEQLIQHSRDYPIDKMIHNQQYMDRLCSFFFEN